MRDRISWTVFTFRPSEEDVLIGEILSEWLIGSKMEMEFMSSPLCVEHDHLVVGVDDEPCDSVDSGIVSGDQGERHVNESLPIIGVIHKIAGYNFKC